jgi:hypothetical protein
MPTARPNGIPSAVWPQEQAPIPCSCRKARLGILGPHRAWAEELRRSRLSGRVQDDVWFDAIQIEAGLDPAELAQ